MILTLQCYRRPDYLKAVLEALRACEGIGDYRLLVNVDPSDTQDGEQVRALVEGIDFMDCQPVWHDHQYRQNKSTQVSLERAFAQDDYVLHVEDDHVLSPDALAWFQSFEDRRDDPDVFDVASFNLYSYDLPYVWARRAPIASGGAWAIWASRLEGLKFLADRAWDLQLPWYAKGQMEVYPLLSRCQNIGEEGGTFVAPLYQKWYQHANKVATCPPGEYHELAPHDVGNALLTGDYRSHTVAP